MDFLVRLLAPAEEPRPFTNVELAGYPADSDDKEKVVLLGIQNPLREILNTIPPSAAVAASGLSEGGGAWEHYKKLENEPYRPFLVPPSLARLLNHETEERVTKVIQPAIENPVHDPQRRLIVGLYGILQYAEAYKRLYGTPQWEEWRKVGLQQFTKQDLVLMLGFLLNEYVPFHKFYFRSPEDMALGSATNFLQYISLDLIHRVAIAYNLNPGQILFAFTYHPDYEAWESLYERDMATEFIQSFDKKSIYDLFPDVYGMPKNEEDIY